MLHHVSIEIPPDEVDRSGEFWGLLGFDEVESPEPLGDAVRWRDRDGTQIHLIITAGHTAPVLGHVAVVAPDHAETKQRLRDAGFQVEDTRQLWYGPSHRTRRPSGRVDGRTSAPQQLVASNIRRGHKHRRRITGNGGYCRRFLFLRRSPWVSRPGSSI
jgi:hypothetical protein